MSPFLQQETENAFGVNSTFANALSFEVADHSVTSGHVSNVTPRLGRIKLVKNAP